MTAKLSERAETRNKNAGWMTAKLSERSERRSAFKQRLKDWAVREKKPRLVQQSHSVLFFVQAMNSSISRPLISPLPICVFREHLSPLKTQLPLYLLPHSVRH